MKCLSYFLFGPLETAILHDSTDPFTQSFSFVEI